MHTTPLEQVLQQLESEEEDVRNKATRFLRDYRKPEHLELLLVASLHDVMDVRVAVAEALGGFPDDERAEGSLLQALEDEEWEVQWAATRALGNLWKEPVLKKVGHKQADKRVNGIESVAKNPDPRFLEPLLSRLDDEEEIQTAAVRALAELGEGAAIPYLRELFDEGDSELKALIEEALLRLGDRNPPRCEGDDALTCEVCSLPFPISFMKKVSGHKEDVRWFCYTHFLEFEKEREPFDGKYKMCKQCKTHWPRVELLESTCPDCRQSNYMSLSETSDEQFRCHRCHKVYGFYDLSPVSKPYKPYCHRCAYKMANNSANQPYLTPHAVEIHEEAYERGFILCEQCRLFVSEDLFEGEPDFRDRAECAGECDNRPKGRSRRR